MRVLLISLTMLIATALSSCGGSGSTGQDAKPAKTDEPGVMTVSGELVLMDGATNEVRTEGGYVETDNCMGDGGYSDISGGTQVTVYDASGTAIALGSLDDGVMTREGYTVPCLFTFTVDDVPADGNVYSVEVSHRGKVNFEKDQAESVALTLGE